MKFKIVQCLTKDDVIEYKLKWSYALKEYAPMPSEFGIAVCEHRVPFFLSLQAHVKIEDIVRDSGLRIFVFPQFDGILRFPYDLIHGIICGYNMKEILEFWRPRPKDNMTEL